MIIWALVDDRTGSNNQSIAVAEKLSTYYIIKKIVYNKLVVLPNFIRNDSLIGIDLVNSSDIAYDLPDVVICAGRRLSPVALNIKKRSKGKTFVINIMDPDFNFDKFDVILLPEHDNLSKRRLKNKNIITTVGSLNRVNLNKVAEEAKKWNEFFVDYNRPLVSLIIGGDTKDRSYNPKEFGLMINNLSKLVNKISGTLLLTTSRRTSDACNEEIRKNINCDYYLYDWKWENDKRNIKKNSLGNPYYAMLGVSDFLIVTADSMSMISECCSTGRPTYIYMPRNSVGKKHLRFCDYLLKNNYVKEFNKSTNDLAKYSYEPLNELERVIKIIIEKIEEKR